MLRKDVKAGGVYGYHHQRDPHIVWPYLVVSTSLYNHNRRENTLTLAKPGTRLDGGDTWSDHSTGLLAIKMRVQDDRSAEFGARAAKIIEVADIQQAALLGKLMDGDTELGTWQLVTNMAYFHGLYTEWNAAKRRREAKVQQMAKDFEVERLATLVRYRAIAARLGDQGVVIAPAGEYDHPAMVKLTFDQAERVLDLVSRTGHLVDEFGIDWGKVLEVSRKDSIDPEVGAFDVYVENKPET